VSSSRRISARVTQKLDGCPQCRSPRVENDAITIRRSRELELANFCLDHTEITWVSRVSPTQKLDGCPQCRSLAEVGYKEFVEQGIGTWELKFSRDAVHRNQLNGSEAFTREIELEIEQRNVNAFSFGRADECVHVLRLRTR
jgi:hypothetical protein